MYISTPPLCVNDPTQRVCFQALHNASAGEVEHHTPASSGLQMLMMPWLCPGRGRDTAHLEIVPKGTAA